MRTDAEIEALISAFEACTIPADDWHHREHLTIAAWYLRRCPRPEASRKMIDGIGRYNAAKIPGMPKCHVSLTLCWLELIARFMSGHDRGQSQAELTGALVDELCKDPTLSEYGSREWLMSRDSARTWVPPDLKPLVPAFTCDR